MSSTLNETFILSRDWIKQHRRSVLVTVSVVGAGYVCYQSVKAYQRQALIEEEEHETHAFSKCQAEKCIETQLHVHFLSIQRISDTTTLPSILLLLRSKLFSLLDISKLVEELDQNKTKNQLSALERIELWDKLKLRSFSHAICCLWALTITVLFVRVQFNILARNIYFDTAQSMSNAQDQDQRKALSRSCQQKYLMCSEFIVDKGVEMLKQDVEAVIIKTLRNTSLKDLLSLADLRDIFSKTYRKLNQSEFEWLSDMILYKGVPDGHSDAKPKTKGDVLSPDEVEAYEQLLRETSDVVQSQEFKDVLAASFQAVLNRVIEEFESHFEDKHAERIHLAKLLQPVSRIGALILDEPDDNRFIRLITDLQQVQSFCTLVYSATV